MLFCFWVGVCLAMSYLLRGTGVDTRAFGFGTSPQVITSLYLEQG